MNRILHIAVDVQIRFVRGGSPSRNQHSLGVARAIDDFVDQFQPNATLWMVLHNWITKDADPSAFSIKKIKSPWQAIACKIFEGMSCVYPRLGDYILNKPADEGPSANPHLAPFLEANDYDIFVFTGFYRDHCVKCAISEVHQLLPKKQFVMLTDLTVEKSSNPSQAEHDWEITQKDLLGHTKLMRSSKFIADHKAAFHPNSVA